MKPVLYRNDINGEPKEYHITYIQYGPKGYELVNATHNTFRQESVTVDIPFEASEAELIEAWAGVYYDESLVPVLKKLIGHALTTSTITNTILFGDPKAGGSKSTIWSTGCDPTYPYEQDLTAAVFHIGSAIRHALVRHEYDTHRDFEDNRWEGSIWAI